jgi:hypothetical protein
VPPGEKVNKPQGEKGSGIEMFDHLPEEWEPPESRHQSECMFCGKSLKEEGITFLEHVRRVPACQERWEDWKERMAEDWQGD